MKAKVIAITIALTVALTAPVYADVYVAVDKDGNAVSGAIVCDAITCGADSVYSKLTLQDGQRYVLQSDGTNGIGNNNPNTNVKIDAATNVWTITTPTHVEEYQTTLNNRINFTPPVPVLDTVTAIVDSATVTIDSATVTSTTNKADVVATIQALLSKVFALLALLGIKG
jgi:hypothetical protein